MEDALAKNTAGVSRMEASHFEVVGVKNDANSSGCSVYLLHEIVSMLSLSWLKMAKPSSSVRNVRIELILVNVQYLAQKDRESSMN